MTDDQASNIIRKAEREIRGQIAEAAAAGSYERVERLSRIARRLAEIVDEAAGTPAIPAPTSQLTAPTAESDEISAAQSTTRADRRGSRKKQYPRFERTRDFLVKIGWSKKGRSEYIHKAPKAGVDAVTRRVVSLGKGGQMFTTEDLLPVKLNGGHDELPSYQAYICLAWLRDIGAVEQHGREGYSVPSDDVVGMVNETWETLPTSRR